MAEVRSSQDMRQVTLLEATDTLDAAQVLGHAFADSPVYLAVFSHLEEARRRRAITRAKHGFVRAMGHHGDSRVVRLGGSIAAVSLVTAPGRYPLSWTDEILQSTGCAANGPTAIGRFLRLTAYMRERHIKEPHFYLFALGVLPDQQGRGLGKTLLAELHRRADAAQVPAYLETEKPINVKLYESVGYRVLTDARIPGLGVRMWTMRRDPRAA